MTTLESTGPAAMAGLRPGDVIVQLGEAPVADLRDLHATLTTSSTPGERLLVSVLRAGGVQTLALTRR